MASTPPLTLYTFSNTCSLVPASLLLHFGIAFKEVPMRPTIHRRGAGGDLEAADGSLSHQDYLRINPTGFVPALVVDENNTENGNDSHKSPTVITEAPAVITYIAALLPQHNLLGVTALQRGQVAEWLAWLSVTLHAGGLSAYWRPERFSDDEKAHDAISHHGKETMKKGYARIEERVRGREFVVGDALTVVEFYLYFFRRWGSEGGLDMSAYPNYESMMRRVEALDGVRRSVKADGQALIFD